MYVHHSHCTAYGRQLPAQTMQLVDSKGMRVDYQKEKGACKSVLGKIYAKNSNLEHGT